MYEWASQAEKNKAMLESAPSSSDEGVLKYKEMSESTEKKKLALSAKTKQQQKTAKYIQGSLNWSWPKYIIILKFPPSELKEASTCL